MFYTALQRTPEEVFPLSFSVESGLTTGIAAGQVQGFYKMTREGVHVER